MVSLQAIITDDLVEVSPDAMCVIKLRMLFPDFNKSSGGNIFRCCSVIQFAVGKKTKRGKQLPEKEVKAFFLSPPERAGIIIRRFMNVSLIWRRSVTCACSSLRLALKVKMLFSLTDVLLAIRRVEAN